MCASFYVSTASQTLLPNMERHHYQSPLLLFSSFPTTSSLILSSLALCAADLAGLARISPGVSGLHNTRLYSAA
jgi:hypothetical protein